MKVNKNKNFDEYAAYVEEEVVRGKYLWLVFFIAAILLFLIVFGFSYSVFNMIISGEKTPISSGDIIFNYVDLGNGNGIHLLNAKEMSDIQGKKLTGSNNVFEFSINGKNIGKNCEYLVVIEDTGSTINPQDVKLYLTEVQNGTEIELANYIPVYSDLEDVEIEGKSYKLLYKKIIPKTVSKFSNDYVLRMWIKEGASDYYNKIHSSKVHIFLEEAGEYHEK